MSAQKRNFSFKKLKADTSFIIKAMDRKIIIEIVFQIPKALDQKKIVKYHSN